MHTCMQFDVYLSAPKYIRSKYIQIFGTRSITRSIACTIV